MAQFKGTSQDGNRVRQGDERRKAEQALFDRKAAAMREESSHGLISLSKNIYIYRYIYRYIYLLRKYCAVLFIVTNILVLGLVFFRIQF